MKYLGLAALLLLGGCIEAADLLAGGLRTHTDYCAAPNGVVLCNQAAAQPVVR